MSNGSAAETIQLSFYLSCDVEGKSKVVDTVPHPRLADEGSHSSCWRKLLETRSQYQFKQVFNFPPDTVPLRHFRLWQDQFSNSQVGF